MKRVLTALVLVLLTGLPISVVACLWDSDTPSDEAKGMPEVIAVLTGRFERNPPLYDEMRLERVSSHLHRHPEDVAAYDDAGVACDRLGRGDEAISWMAKKRAQLDRHDASRPEVKEQLYRYHANLGTFFVHRWARQGADRAKLNEVNAGRREIARALEINPKAHFGREKYQLQAMDWIIDPPKAIGKPYLPNLLGWVSHPGWESSSSPGFVPDPKVADEAVRGLAGLIVLGNAWESVDIFNALKIALQHDTLGFPKRSDAGRNTLAYFACLRCQELIDAGKGSILPDAPRGVSLKSMLPKPFEYAETTEPLDEAFVRLHRDADAWHAARTAFMVRRLREGRHPDTDRDFWNGYTWSPIPALPR